MFSERGRNRINIAPYVSSNEAFVSSIIPEDWNFDFRSFIVLNQNRSYFHAYVLYYFKVPVGFGNLLIFGDIGWIGNIIIKEPFRRIGLGSRLLKYLIECGVKKGVKSFNLISTSIGITLYQKFGFQSDFRYYFYNPPVQSRPQKINCNIRRAVKEDIPSISHLDRLITGEDREEFIRLHLSGTLLISSSENKLNAFLIETLGDGLIIAKEPASGLDLIKIKAQSQCKRIVIPENNHIAREFLELNGFSYCTSLNRMRLGEKYIWQPACVYSRGAGYCG
jgi:GNAT superfamily N-acetyltransferase